MDANPLISPILSSTGSLLAVFACGCLPAVAAATAERGLAAQFPNDQGIARHPAVIFATDFESGIQKPLTIDRKGVTALADPALAFSGKGCAEITATKDVDEGGDISLKWDQGVETCYMRVYIRFDQDTLMPHHFINISAMTDTYKYRWGGGAGLKPEGGKNGKVGTTLEPPQGDNGEWKFYSYWHEMHSWQTPEGKADGRPHAFYGNNFSVQHSPALMRDEWICVEMMLKLNTVGKYDGEQAFWINGVKIGHWQQGSPVGTWIRENFATYGNFNKNPKPFEGYNWRTDNALLINHIKLQWYLSKDQSWPKMTSARNTVYFDNLVVAKSYIGPMVTEKQR